MINRPRTPVALPGHPLTRSLDHLFTPSLATVHPCALNHIGPKNRSKMHPMFMNRIKLTFFYFCSAKPQSAPGSSEVDSRRILILRPRILVP